MEPEMNKPAVENTFPAAQVAEKSPLTIIVGVVGSVIVLLGVGWYVFNMNQPQEQLGVAAPVHREVTTQPAPATADTAAAALSTQGTSDDVSAIDTDLKATDLNSLNDASKI